MSSRRSCYAKLAGAKLYPSVDVLARGGGKLSGDGSGIQGGVLSANWELDLWGRVRYGRAASAAQAMSAEADYEYARQSLAAQVAKSWFMATEAGLQIEAARETIRASEQLVRLADDRTRIGVANQEDVYVARATIGTYQDAHAPTRIEPRTGDSFARDPARPLSRRRRGGHAAVTRVPR